MKIKVIGGELTAKEKENCIARATAEIPAEAVEEIVIIVGSEYIDMDVYYRAESAPVPFQRIRRITGYLVGDLRRFNDAKRKEVEERVKHGGV